MPRLKPAEGYVTAGEAVRLLEISDSMLSQLVKQGKLKRYGPEGRKHKFYKLSEVEAELAARQTFDAYAEAAPAAFFDAATEADMSTIVDMDLRTFAAPFRVETYLGWLRKNPRSFFVLRAREATGTLVGFACLLPLRPEVMARFLRDEIALDDITPGDVLAYEPGGGPYSLYVIALVIDPAYRRAADKRAYGAALARGIFSFLLDLAREGVEIERISARSERPDGIEMMRHLGMPQVRPSVPPPPEHKKRLQFSVRVRESGFHLLMKYCDVLDEWRRAHACPTGEVLRLEDRKKEEETP